MNFIRSDQQQNYISSINPASAALPSNGVPFITLVEKSFHTMMPRKAILHCGASLAG